MVRIVLALLSLLTANRRPGEARRTRRLARRPGPSGRTFWGGTRGRHPGRPGRGPAAPTAPPVVPTADAPHGPPGDPRVAA